MIDSFKIALARLITIMLLVALIASNWNGWQGSYRHPRRGVLLIWRHVQLNNRNECERFIHRNCWSRSLRRWNWWTQQRLLQRTWHSSCQDAKMHERCKPVWKVVWQRHFYQETRWMQDWLNSTFIGLTNDSNNAKKNRFNQNITLQSEGYEVNECPNMSDTETLKAKESKEEKWKVC